VIVSDGAYTVGVWGIAPSCGGGQDVLSVLQISLVGLQRVVYPTVTQNTTNNVTHTMSHAYM
jgi:hypothetical protein